MNTQTLIAILTVSIVWVLPGRANQTTTVLAEEVAEQVVAAAKAGQPAPVLSINNVLTVKQAYQIQTLAVKQRLGSAAPQGFKAGLTSAAAQKKFAVKQAVAGVLLANGDHRAQDGRYIIEAGDFNNIMLEAEIGFRIKTTITERISDIKTLKTNVAAVLPVVEFPDVSFDQPRALQGVDIIANNVLAKQFIAANEHAIDLSAMAALDINQLTILIKKEGNLILEGQSSDAMGDQWQALLWLVNQTIDSGWQIKSGQLMITGALGKMLPATPGSYQIDYGSLGQIDFLVR